MSADRVEAAYRQVYPRLWRALVAYGADPELASDAVAESFSQVLARGDEVRDVEAWVWRSAFRIANGMLARRNAAEPLPADLGSVVDSTVVELIAQLQLLSAQQRSVVVLRYVGGFTAGEIAELLHTSAGTVRVQLHRAHAALRLTMEESDGR